MRFDGARPLEAERQPGASFREGGEHRARGGLHPALHRPRSFPRAFELAFTGAEDDTAGCALRRVASCVEVGEVQPSGRRRRHGFGRSDTERHHLRGAVGRPGVFRLDLRNADDAPIDADAEPRA